ncbi:hypothetical protein THAOC_02071 [Thalassiosira oceanica]|uniref:Uncharacterized protein n=1 Tax=Thalassiosira oceanica TaxID=159749 RepID=K0TQK0_THAOC|nr:hypothetical protein THAOC_02071 [Thalassiosira oceanica]|eukprot:EJK76182.1 hypothetical protein THAOC_02071 [Thalassiosira oceanica]
MSPSKDSGSYCPRASAGGEMAGILKSGVFDEKLKVSYDSVNEVWKDKMLVEVGHSLEQVRRKLKMQNRTPIDAATAFPEMRDCTAPIRRVIFGAIRV